MPSTTTDAPAPDGDTAETVTGPETRPVSSLVVAGLVLLSSGATLYEMNGVSPAFVAAGFVATALALGPVATTAPGRRFSAWFRGIHGAARLAIIIGMVALVFGLAFAFDVAPVGVQSAVFGSAVGLAASVVYRLLADRFGDG